METASPIPILPSLAYVISAQLCLVFDGGLFRRYSLVGRRPICRRFYLSDFLFTNVQNSETLLRRFVLPALEKWRRP